MNLKDWRKKSYEDREAFIKTAFGNVSIGRVWNGESPHWWAPKIAGEFVSHCDVKPSGFGSKFQARRAGYKIRDLVWEEIPDKAKDDLGMKRKKTPRDYRWT
jgi:hypothetical protein